MRGYLLPGDFGRKLAAVKAPGLLGGFIFVWIKAFDPHTHGPAPYFWAALVLLVGLNTLLLWNLPIDAERQERRYLLAFFLDVLATTYLTIFQPDLYTLTMISLVLASSFYNFVLSRSSGILVAVLTSFLLLFTVLIGLQGGPRSIFPVRDPISFADGIAILTLGLSLTATTAWLVRKIRRSFDTMYLLSDELAFDLTSQAVDASIYADELVEKNNEIQTVLTVLQNIVSVLEWDDLFKNIVAALHHRFTFDKFSLYLYRDEQGELELTVERGAEKASGAAKNIKPGDGVVGWTFMQTKGVAIPDVRVDERYREFSERGKRIRSIVAAPLIFRGEALGVMCLDSEKVGAFDQKAADFLGEIAPLISIAVSNSISYVAVKEESHTDNLTGLKNHRGFMETFLPLLSDAYTDDFPLSVLAMDIDFFKKINDTYGHQVGNLVLIDFANILKDFFRGSDLVGRTGGEEFIVVLNGTPSEIAPRIAEQLRRKVEQHQFPISLQKDAFKQVTISIGLATTADSNLQPDIAKGSRSRGEADVYLRNETDIATQIIENADQALYVAKDQGRNQVRLSYQYPVRESGPDLPGGLGAID
ncbi:MAG: sensor domain-containing diguanylate cyclase [bacterium]|nr:sensor domain-containing diguanylate cyclase [bacterium]